MCSEITIAARLSGNVANRIMKRAKIPKGVTSERTGISRNATRPMPILINPNGEIRKLRMPRIIPIMLSPPI